MFGLIDLIMLWNRKKKKVEENEKEGTAPIRFIVRKVDYGKVKAQLRIIKIDSSSGYASSELLYESPVFFHVDNCESNVKSWCKANGISLSDVHEFSQDG